MSLRQQRATKALATTTDMTPTMKVRTEERRKTHHLRSFRHSSSDSTVISSGREASTSWQARARGHRHRTPIANIYWIGQLQWRVILWSGGEKCPALAFLCLFCGTYFIPSDRMGDGSIEICFVRHVPWDNYNIVLSSTLIVPERCPGFATLRRRRSRSRRGRIKDVVGSISQSVRPFLPSSPRVRVISALLPPTSPRRGSPVVSRFVAPAHRCFLSSSLYCRVLWSFEASWVQSIGVIPLAM